MSICEGFFDLVPKYAFPFYPLVKFWVSGGWIKQRGSFQLIPIGFTGVDKSGGSAYSEYPYPPLLSTLTPLSKYAPVDYPPWHTDATGHRDAEPAESCRINITGPSAPCKGAHVRVTFCGTRLLRVFRYSQKWSELGIWG